MKPLLSIIVVFFNNKREAPRTLYTLSKSYQKDVEDLDYEVIAVDSNSPEPLSPKVVKSFGAKFSYHFTPTDYPSPVEALRTGLAHSKGEYLMVIIDGAHMLTPNILSKWRDVIKAFPASFVYNQRYHLGKFRQNDHVGYNQAKEDKLMSSVDWKNDGYSLYGISDYQQSEEWWFSKHFESNCFILPKQKIIEHGSVYKDYFSLGGGFLNLAMFKDAIEDPDLTSVMLIGETTFHQFHGGTTTNVAREEVRLRSYKKEYFKLNKTNYGRPINTNVHYWGDINKAQEPLLKPRKRQAHYVNIVRELMFENQFDEALFFIDRATEIYPYSIMLFAEKVKIYREQGRYEEAEQALEKALIINSLDSVLLNLKGEMLLVQSRFDESIEVFKTSHELDISDPVPLIKLSKAYLKKGNITQSKKYAASAVERAIELKLPNKFLTVFTFIKSQNYQSLIDRMFKFADEIPELSYNFDFLLGKTELMPKGEEREAYTDKLFKLYFLSKVNINQTNRLANLLIWQNKKEDLWKLSEDLKKRKLIFYSHLLKAKWHFSHTNPQACLDELHHALPNAPTVQTQAACYNIKSKCEHQQKHFKASLTSANKAVEINPNNPDFLFAKAKAHLGLKQARQAKILLERIINISNYSLKFNALLHLFDIALKQGNYKKCESYLTEAAKVKPNHERIQRKQQKLTSARK